MKAGQFSDQQIVQILQQAERDKQTISAVCRSLGIAEATFYRWRGRSAAWLSPRCSDSAS
jgi:transposase-like protein